jgi:hypothetical protein
MMKTITFPIYAFLICLLFLSACGSGNTASVAAKSVVFPNVNYAKVVAYDYEGIQGGNIYEKGKLYHSIKKEQVLSAEQISNLLDVLNDEGTYGGDVSRCFNPRLGIVFYDAEGKALAQVSICFECNQHQASPSILAQDNTRKVTKMTGYSAEGRTKLVDLCKSLSFSNCGTVDREEATSEVLNNEDLD